MVYSGSFSTCPVSTSTTDSVGPHETALHQLLQPGERDCRGWLTPHAVGADLGFRHRDFRFAHLLDATVRCFQHAQRLLPRSWIANANRGRQGVCFDRHQFSALLFVDGAIERICAFCLNDRNLRHRVNQSEPFHLKECFAQRRIVAQVAAGNDDVVGHLPIQLLEQLDGGSLLPFQPIRIH